VSVRIAYNGTTADGERMIAPLRAVAPAISDTVRDMPYTEVPSIHNEPIEPVPYYERSIMLREFPAQAQDKLIELVGPDAETSLVIAELRALGGAWDREPEVPNAVATRGLPYVSSRSVRWRRSSSSKVRSPSCSTAWSPGRATGAV
jgi:hypothetical protein